jgi:uncharacterized membrane protein YgdD (TMEM256/DUF423 family)
LLSSAKIFLFLGAVNAMVSVLLGAFGTHGLKSKLSAQAMSTFQTGVEYHFYHSLGLLIVGIFISQLPVMGIKVTGWLMFAGIILFSGSLYLLALTGLRQLGMITPVGGLCFITAWGLLAYTVFKQ